MLHSVKSLCPTLYSFVFSVYSSHSSLYWEDRTVSSAEGVQQGDPLGPLLFCLTLHQFLVRLKSPFHVGYLDNVSLRGPVESLVGDISIIREAVNLGLVVNSEKSEVIGGVSDGVDQLTCSSVLPGAQSILPSSVCFLGSPIGDINHVSSVICENISFLHQLGERLCLFSVHDSIVLLCNSFAILRLIFCWGPHQTFNLLCCKSMISFSAHSSALYWMLISPLIVQLGLRPPYQYERVGWDSDLQYSLHLPVIYLLLLLLLIWLISFSPIPVPILLLFDSH